MMINQSMLPIAEYSRPGRKLKKTMGIIMHWVGIPFQNALNVKNYFETDCNKNKHYSSVHYIVDLNGDTYQLIPDDEMAYHCGSSKVDPKSLRIYTDWAREKFGYFASSKNCSPNQVTIGIELCTINNNGDFNGRTILSAIDLVVNLLKKHNLTIEEVGTHNMVVGWKDCPRLWTNKPVLFDAFKNDIQVRLQNGNYTRAT